MIQVHALIERLKKYNRDRRCNCQQCADSQAAAGCLELMADELREWRTVGDWISLDEDSTNPCTKEILDEKATKARQLSRIANKHLDLMAPPA